MDTGVFFIIVITSIYLQCTSIFASVSLAEQYDHVLNRMLESRLGRRSPALPRRRAGFNFDMHNVDNIIGTPSLPSHLPEAEAILPGHTLIRPAMGMLKSSVKFPHRELENGFGVDGNIDNLGIRFDGRNERVLYSGFRRTPSDYIMVVPKKPEVGGAKSRFDITSVVLDMDKKERVKKSILDKIKPLNEPTKKWNLYVVDFEDVKPEDKREITFPPWPAKPGMPHLPGMPSIPGQSLSQGSLDKLKNDLLSPANLLYLVTKVVKDAAMNVYNTTKSFVDDSTSSVKNFAYDSSDFLKRKWLLATYLFSKDDPPFYKRKFNDMLDEEHNKYNEQFIKAYDAEREEIDIYNDQFIKTSDTESNTINSYNLEQTRRNWGNQSNGRNFHGVDMFDEVGFGEIQNAPEKNDKHEDDFLNKYKQMTMKYKKQMKLKNKLANTMNNKKNNSKVDNNKSSMKKNSKVNKKLKKVSFYDAKEVEAEDLKRVTDDEDTDYQTYSKEVTDTDTELKQEHSKMKWLFNTKNQFNNINIDEDRPDFEELMPKVEESSKKKEWHFFNKDWIKRQYGENSLI